MWQYVASVVAWEIFYFIAFSMSCLLDIYQAFALFNANMIDINQWPDPLPQEAYNLIWKIECVCIINYVDRACHKALRLMIRILRSPLI